MYIKYLKIKNYRNLDNMEFYFDKDINYIVGDNNIGKTNLLKLFDKLFNNALTEDDYAHKNAKIVIELKLSISHEENEIYQFNLMEEEVDLIVTQGVFESIPLLIGPNNEKYDYKILKKVVFKQLTNEKEFDNSKIESQRLDKILKNDFKNMRIKHDNFISNQLYLTMASYLIYKTILNEYQNSFNEFKELVYIKDGKKVLPIIISIDEPELHLNPYLQRTLINYYKKILNNQDDTFKALMKADFDIDLLDSTLFVVTHSTEALVDDYKSIVRFYKKTNGNGVACGAHLSLKPNISKHLSMMFSDIKEAFFCKKAIIVEGITEYGAFKKFAEALETPLDYEGICLINAQGEGSISKIRTLLNAFKIECFAVYDGDVKSSISEKSSHNFFTEAVCFEMEIVKTLVNAKEFELLEKIAFTIPGASSQLFDDMYCKKTFEKIEFKYTFDKSIHLKDVKRTNIDLYEALYFTWFYRKKGLYLGRIIASMLPPHLIPKCYQDVILASTSKKLKVKLD